MFRDARKGSRGEQQLVMRERGDALCPSNGANISASKGIW